MSSIMKDGEKVQEFMHTLMEDMAQATEGNFASMAVLSTMAVYFVYVLTGSDDFDGFLGEVNRTLKDMQEHNIIRKGTIQ